MVEAAAATAEGGLAEALAAWGVRGAEIRPYQDRIWRQATAGFAGGRYDGAPIGPFGSVQVVAPCGSGKSVVGLAVGQWAWRTLGIPTFWVTQRRNLLEQARREQARFGFDFPLATFSMSAGVHPRLLDLIPPDRSPLLVVDESQHDAARSMANVHARANPRLVLGLSATFYRSDKLTLCFQHVVRDADIHALIREGWLSPFDHYTIDDWAPETVARHWLLERERWGRSLLFFHREEQAARAVALLRAGGCRADLVTARTDREAQIQALEAGELDCLVNMRILTEGFNFPGLRTVWVSPSDKGPTVQMAGRVLRKHPGHPVKQVVQSKDTRHPFTNHAAARERRAWREGRWRLLGNRGAAVAKLQVRCFRAALAARPAVPAFLQEGWKHRERIRRDADRAAGEAANEGN